MKHELRLRVSATVEDNPWLPEDVLAIPGLCIKLEPGARLSDVVLDIEWPEHEARMGARAIVRRLQAEGLL